MKSHVNKNEKTNTLNLLFILTVLVFSGVFLTFTPVSNHKYNISAKNSTGFNGYDSGVKKLSTPASTHNNKWNSNTTKIQAPVFDFNEAKSNKLEEEKLMKKKDEAEMEVLYAKMEEYLQIEEEPKMGMPLFMETELNNSEFEETRFTTVKNDYLERLAKQKNQELAEYYELFWKIKEYSKNEEKDNPLKLEDWMVNEAFWKLNK